MTNCELKNSVTLVIPGLCRLRQPPRVGARWGAAWYLTDSGGEEFDPAWYFQPILLRVVGASKLLGYRSRRERTKQ